MATTTQREGWTDVEAVLLGDKNALGGERLSDAEERVERIRQTSGWFLAPLFTIVFLLLPLGIDTAQHQLTAIGIVAVIAKMLQERGDVAPGFDPTKLKVATAFMLMLAYSASVGGLLTPVGSRRTSSAAASSRRPPVSRSTSASGSRSRSRSAR